MVIDSTRDNNGCEHLSDRGSSIGALKSSVATNNICMAHKQSYRQLSAPNTREKDNQDRAAGDAGIDEQLIAAQKEAQALKSQYDKLVHKRHAKVQVLSVHNVVQH
jgi:hypothetical protein